jgi:hypothetical protein
MIMGSREDDDMSRKERETVGRAFAPPPLAALLLPPCMVWTALATLILTTWTCGGGGVSVRPI